MSEHFQAAIGRDQIWLSPSCGSMIGLEDGRLMLAWAQSSATPGQPVMVNYSEDCGRTWSDPVPLTLEDGGDLPGAIGPQLARLPSGHLGMAVRTRTRQGKDAGYFSRFFEHSFHVSTDEGGHWSPGVTINPDNVYAHGESSGVDALRCLSDGRLVLPFNRYFGATPREEKSWNEDLYGERMTGGWAGRTSFSYTYYSDDEGRTWHRSRNEVQACLDDGLGLPLPRD